MRVRLIVKEWKRPPASKLIEAKQNLEPGTRMSGLIPATKPQRTISHKKAQNAQKGKGIKGFFCAFCAFLRLKKRFWFLFWN